MAKSQKDFLKDLQLSAKSQAEQRFDVIADVKDVLTVDVQEEKAKLDTYKEIEEVAVTSEVLEIFEHSSSEIEKIKSEDITPLKAEYTNCAELAKSNADDLEKEEERSKGVYSIDRQIREARKEVHSSKEAWRKAQKDAKIQGRDKSNIFGRMLGRFTGIDMGQDAFRQAKKSVKQAHKAYRSSKRSLARVKQQMAERKERLEEKRAKATYYKEKMIDIEQKIKAAKGKISHVNQKLLVHTQSLHSQYQVVQTYLKLKSIKEKLKTDGNFRNQMKDNSALGDDLVNKLDNFKLPANSLVISLKNPLTPEMISTLEGNRKAIEDIENKINNNKKLKADHEKAIKDNEGKIASEEASITENKGKIEKKKEERNGIRAEIAEIQGKLDVLTIQAGETSESVQSSLDTKSEQLKKMEEEGKKAGDPEYDKLSNEIHLLDMKKEYLLSSEKVKNISVQIEALDPLTNTDQINALEAQRRAILENMTRSPYALELKVLQTDKETREAKQEQISAEIEELENKNKTSQKNIENLKADIEKKKKEIEGIDKSNAELELAKQGAEDSKQMIEFNAKIEEVEKTTKEPTIISTLKQIKQEVQRKLQERLEQKLGKDKEPLPEPDGRD